jgi:hypothetical protein
MLRCRVRISVILGVGSICFYHVKGWEHLSGLGASVICHVRGWEHLLSVMLRVGSICYLSCYGLGASVICPVKG